MCAACLSRLHVAYLLQSMLAMWRLILGHGKPRMFAALAAQRAALAAAPRSPAKGVINLERTARWAVAQDVHGREI